MKQEILLMIFLICNLLVTFLNIIMIKHLMDFWKDCLKAIKEYHDSNYEISKSITSCVSNLFDVMGYKKVNKDDTRITK